MEPVEPAAITGPAGGCAFKPPGFGEKQRVAVRRRVGALPVAQNSRPGLRNDGKEIERHLPPAGKIAGDQLREFRPTGAFRLDLIDERGKVARQPDGIGRRGRHDEFFREFRRDMSGQALFPQPDQRRQKQKPVDLGDRRGKVEHGFTGGMEGRAVLVELAERADGRQDHRAAGGALHKLRAQFTRGAPGRHVDGDVRQRQRVVSRSETGYEPSVRQRLGQRRQEGYAGRDRENTRRGAAGHVSKARARATAASAGAIASGVPTVIQLPQRGMPNSRPATIAASK